MSWRILLITIIIWIIFSLVLFWQLCTAILIQYILYNLLFTVDTFNILLLLFWFFERYYAYNNWQGASQCKLAPRCKKGGCTLYNAF